MILPPMKHSSLLLAAAVACCAVGPRIAAAEDFFAGRKITITTFGSPGSNYDMNARLVSRHLGKYIPGHPSFLVINQQGAGGLTAMNYAARIAPQDGTLITLVSDGLLIFEATGRQGLSDSLAKFKWLAGLSNSNAVTVTWHASGVKTLDDAKLRTVRVSGAGAGAMTFVPELYNSFLGTKFAVIQGYASSAAQNLAMQRGETDGRGGVSWNAMKSLLPKEIADGKLIVLGQIGERREPDLPNVPLLTDLVASDPRKLAIARFVSKSLSLSRSFAAPPGVPDERVAMLRNAFEKVVKDPEFVSESERLLIDIDFVPGAEAESLVKEVLSTPKDVIDATRAMMKL